VAPWEDLKKEIAENRAVIIVGAGVSMQATSGAECASWTGLLGNGAQWCAALDPKLKEKWLGKVLDDIASDDLTELLSAAYKITEKLGGAGGGEYRRWLHESVGELQAKDKAVLEALRDIAAPIATTNYDSLLEDVTALEPVTWRDHARVQSVLQGAERAILHLHGYWRQPESVVLGIKSYEETLNDPHAQSVLHALSLVKTLVFVGFGAGLRDPNFGRLLDWRGKISADAEARSYRLALDREREALQQEHPPAQRILVLSYGSEHRDLIPFLRSLAPQQKLKPASGPPGLAPALPPPRACFGRQAEIDLLVASVLAPQPQPFPVLGGPGIGKSTITIEAIHRPEVVRRYGSRRYFVRCEAAPSRSAVVAVIARLLGIDPAPGVEAAVLAALGAEPALLVLDNFETPWEAEQSEAEELLGLLAGVPGLALVASVRGGERPGGVSWAEALRTVPLDPVAARQEFLDIAGKKFEADPVLDTLLGAVDRVPLAIHLLAHAAEPDPSLENLWQRWQRERTALLKRGAGADRLSNIELSYEISWDGPRMTEEGRRLLSVLAQIPAGVAGAHLSMVNPSGPAAATALRASGLVYDEGGRLRVLAPVREYVGRMHPPRADDLGRAAAFYSRLLMENGPKVGKSGGQEAARTLGPEARNIEHVILASIDRSSADERADTASAWAEFARFTGAGSSNLTERLAESIPADISPGARARCLRALGDIALARSDHAEARRRYEGALPLYQQVGAVLGEANCIRSLGDIALARSDHAEARQRYEGALPLYQQVGAVLGEANCIQGLGDIALRESDVGSARQRYHEALALYERIQEPYSIGGTHERLARIAKNEDDRNRHVQAAREAWLSIDRHDLIKEIDDEFGTASAAGA
jgi:tetratricopeptide (TPR) repeat protein